MRVSFREDRRSPLQVAAPVGGDGMGKGGEQLAAPRLPLRQRAEQLEEYAEVVMQRPGGGIDRANSAPAKTQGVRAVLYGSCPGGFAAAFT